MKNLPLYTREYIRAFARVTVTPNVIAKFGVRQSAEREKRDENESGDERNARVRMYLWRLYLTGNKKCVFVVKINFFCGVRCLQFPLFALYDRNRILKANT